MLPQCILFDLDGTLLDSLPGIESSVRDAFLRCGVPVPELRLREGIGPPIRTILARAGNVADQGRLDALEAAFRDSYDSQGWKQAQCFPEVASVLGRMRAAGHRLFVVSNKPLRVSRMSLEKEEILGCFESIVTRDSRVPPYESKAAMISELLASYRLSPAECVMVGDTIEDAKAAATTGIAFIRMTSGYGAFGAEGASALCSLDHFSQFLPMIPEEPFL